MSNSSRHLSQGSSGNTLDNSSVQCINIRRALSELLPKCQFVSVNLSEIDTYGLTENYIKGDQRLHYYCEELGLCIRLNVEMSDEPLNSLKGLATRSISSELHWRMVENCGEMGTKLFIVPLCVTTSYVELLSYLRVILCYYISLYHTQEDEGEPPKKYSSYCSLV